MLRNEKNTAILAASYPVHVSWFAHEHSIRRRTFSKGGVAVEQLAVQVSRFSSSYPLSLFSFYAHSFILRLSAALEGFYICCNAVEMQWLLRHCHCFFFLMTSACPAVLRHRL
jgi:hypothetical protein